MTELPLTPIDVTGLTIASNPCDLRRDLGKFVSYVSNRTVKRSHRENTLSKIDLKRLAKLTSDPSAASDIQKSGYSPWINYVDQTALNMGFVKYDVKGRYMGYTSYAASFPDNYIEVNQGAYQTFLGKSLQAREQNILNSLIESSDKEFFSQTPLTVLDSFDIFGSAVGVLPTLDFPGARRFLFNLMKDCQSDVWYSAASFIQYLKKRHPFFLIPEKPKMPKNTRRKMRRYENFWEQRGRRYGERIEILETAPDSFERVEGRYVERFLERIPLSLGYVDTAYYDDKNPKLFPSLNQLKAFRVKPSFIEFMNGQTASPTVIVQPNFEININSAFYPLRAMDKLEPLTSIVTEDTAIILKLQKKKVTKQLAENENLDVTKLLKKLSARDIPQNVLLELEEWQGHSDTFTLYEGFGILEGSLNKSAEKYIVETISSNLRIVKSPKSLFSALERSEMAPTMVKHKNDEFHTMPQSAKTAFPKKSPKPKQKQKKATLKREFLMTLHFPSYELLEIFRDDLIKERCSVEVNQEEKSLTFAKKYEPQIKKIIRRIKKNYQIQFEDVE